MALQKESTRDEHADTRRQERVRHPSRGNGHAAAGPEDADPYRWVGLGVVLIGVFMAILDILIVYVAIPSIQGELGATSAEIELVVAGYGLTYAVLLVTGGRLGDLYGRRRLFMIGIGGFVLLSALCGLATSPEWLIAGRLVQGATAAIMYPQATAIIQATFTGEDRDWAFALVGVAIGLAMVGSFIIGGLLVQADLFGWGWRSIFFLNVPVGLAALAGSAAFVSESRAEKRPGLDWTGVLLLTVGLTLLIYPLAMGPQAGWPAWTFVALAASVPVLAGFVLWERRLARREAAPLMKPALFSDRAFVVGLLLVLAFFLVPPAFFLVAMLYLQKGLGLSALGAGLAIAPDGVGFLAGSFLAARFQRTLGRHVLSIGTALMAVGVAGVALTAHLVGVDVTSWSFVPAMLVIGVGHGLVMAPLFGILLSNVPSDEAGAASGVLFTTQQFTEAVSVVLVGIVFFGTLAGSAGPASEDAAARLRADLAAEGVPAARADALASRFQNEAKALIEQQSKGGHAGGGEASSESHASPFSGLAPAVQKQAREAMRAVKAGVYAKALIRALLWSAAVLVATIGLVFLLPKARPVEEQDAAAA